jgi:hypothetical protein
VAWLRLLVAYLSPRRHSFDPRSAHVGFLVDRSEQEHVFTVYFDYALSVLFNQRAILICIYRLLLPEGQEVKPENYAKNSELPELGKRWIENYFHLVFRVKAHNHRTLREKPI